MAWWIARSFARQRFSRWIARSISQRMAADCSFFHSSTVSTIDCLPYGTADGMADRLFVRSSTAFTTVYTPDCPVDISGFLLLAVVNGFQEGLRTVLLRGWQWIAHTSTRPRLSQRFACLIAWQLAADCSFFLSSTAFMTVCTPYCSADGSGLFGPLPSSGFHDGFRAVFLSGW